MRGLSQPTGALVAPQVNGWTKGVRQALSLSTWRPPRSCWPMRATPRASRWTLPAPNNRYINDEEICQAVTAMWAKIGVKAKLRTLPLVTYFPMIQRFEASIYMLGWGVPTFDALVLGLQSLLRTVGAGGDGNYNVGRYSNPRMDCIGRAHRRRRPT
jgi:peptide/nickel transport system substrate-binding protein